MPVETRQVGPDDLPLYAMVSIAFEVRSIFRVEADKEGLGGLVLRYLDLVD